MAGFGGSNNKRKAIDFSDLGGNDDDERYLGGGAMSESDSEQSGSYQRPYPGGSTSVRRAASEDYGPRKRYDEDDDRGRSWNRDGDASKRGSSNTSGRGGWQSSGSASWKTQGSWSDGGRPWQGSEAGSTWKKSNEVVQSPSMIRRGNGERSAEWYHLDPEMRKILVAMFPVAAPEVSQKEKDRVQLMIDRFGVCSDTGLAARLVNFLEQQSGKKPTDEECRCEEALIWRAWCEGASVVYEQSGETRLPAFPSITGLAKDLLEQDQYLGSFLTALYSA